ncbi:hypothetical protein NDU88_000316 [Pleurodeles waltl]|uniref:Uncharacterized protein n=1 Tax=Pleurodeles waltl TaxID=8319 RepID=A0AAV7UPM2_PLEWA|nr:hypothetical protein NDU88_000316 [Pleurodeles waltl]
MAPKVAKTFKTPRVSRGNPGLETNTERRDKKHPSGPSKNPANVQRKAQQSGSLMEKLKLQASGPLLPGSYKDAAAADMEPQIP